MSSLTYRHFKDRLFFWTVCIFSALTAIPLILIIWEVRQERLQTNQPEFFYGNGTQYTGCHAGTQ